MIRTRRRFLGSLAAILSTPAWLEAAHPAEPWPLAFSTLGCPRWDWPTILDRARHWGYAALELRGLQGEMDLTRRPEFQGTRLSGSRKDLEAAGLRLSDLGASTRLHEVEPAVRQAQWDEGRRFIDLAHHLGAPFVRVFGDRWVPGEPKEATLDRVAAGLQELSRHAQGSGVGVLLESHGDFCDSATLLQILTRAARPNVGLVWDVHHTVVVGQEDPATTLRVLGRYIHHTHLKDSKPAGAGVKYVLTGMGTIPLRETIRLLVQAQYRGFYSFEWEKAWHPEIEEPEVAFPQFSEVVRGYLKEAGYRPPA